jgi:hypothetical protein
MAEALFCFPHSYGKRAFFRTHDLGVYRRGAQGRVTEPTLHEVRRHERLKRVYTKGMTEALWHSGWSNDIRFRHDFFDAPPGGGPAPMPDPPICRIWMALLSPQVKSLVEFTEHFSREGHLPDEAASAPLQCCDIRNAAVDIDSRRRQCEDFRNPATAQTQHKAKESNVQRRASGCSGETASFGGIEVFTATSGLVQVYPAMSIVAHCVLG